MNNNKNKDILYNIAYILTASSAAFIFLLSILAAGFILCNIVPYDLVSLNDHWTDESGQVFALDTFAKSENEIAIPQKIYYTFTPTAADTALIFRCRNMFADIYLNGVLVSEDTKELAQIYGSSPGSRWHFVPLPTEGESVQICISGYSCFTNTHGLIDNIYIGPAKLLYQKITSERIPGFLLSTSLQIFGAIMLLLYFVIKKRYKLGRDMLYLGLATFFSAQWASTESLMWQLFFGYSEFFHLLGYLALISIPTFLGQLAAYRLQGKGKVISQIYSLLACINLIVTSLLHVTGIEEFHYTLTPTHILIIILIPLMIPLALSYTEKKSSERKKFIIFLLFAIFATSLLTAVMKYMLGQYTNYATYVRVAIICFISYLIICQFNQIINLFTKGLKADMMHTMALTDYLTGLYNRTAFGEDTEKLEQIACETGGFGVIQFDVNNLKYVNDNLGHEKGDQLLTFTAKGIQQSFQSYGKCYRMGGDEFLVILTGKDPEKDYTLGVEALQNFCEKISQLSNLGFQIEIAHGFVLVEKGTPLAEALDKADMLMYENKKMLKEHAITETCATRHT